MVEEATDPLHATSAGKTGVPATLSCICYYFCIEQLLKFSHGTVSYMMYTVFSEGTRAPHLAGRWWKLSQVERLAAG